jgi:hypothetical protein
MAKIGEILPQWWHCLLQLLLPTNATNLALEYKGKYCMLDDTGLPTHLADEMS